MNSITINENTVKVQIKSNPRAKKTVRIEVNSEKKLTVLVPKGKELDVAELLNKHRRLIERKYEEYKSKIHVKNETGFLFKGKRYALEWNPINSITEEKVTLSDEKIRVFYQKNRLSMTVLKEWIRQKTIKLIKKVLEEHPQLKIPKRITVTDTKRWGYTRDNGVIVFNWQLSALPEHLSEYVVIHELVHLLYMNHQNGFKSKLIQFEKDYHKLEKELKMYLPFDQ